LEGNTRSRPNEVEVELIELFRERDVDAAQVFGSSSRNAVTVAIRTASIVGAVRASYRLAFFESK
jgi:hypothetical protein